MKTLSIFLVIILIAIFFEGLASMAQAVAQIPVTYSVTGSSSLADPSYPMSLTPGWNLVSFPVVNSSLNASKLAGTGVSVVSAFNATTGDYNSFIVGVSPSEDDFALSANYGYFLYCHTNTTLVISGFSPSNPGVVINPGWNMIGWSSYNNSTANSVCAALSSGSGHTVISQFVPSTGDYNSYIAGISPNSFNFGVSPGQGYFLYSASSTPQTLYYNNISQTPSAPVASFTSNVTSGSAPLNIQFTDMSIGYPTSWNWQFGDGGTSASQDPVHKYNAPGRYNVSFTATNAAGSNMVTEVGYIIVYGANFSANVTSGIAWNVSKCTVSPNFGAQPLVVQFNDTSLGATSWQWNFGDGTNNSTVQDPVHSFANAWSYNVTLTVTTSGGVYSTEKYDYINVLLPITGNVANPLNLTLANLNNYPQVSISNHTYGAHHEYYQMWATGASLNDVLNDSKVNDTAEVVTFYGSDGVTATVMLSLGPGNIEADNLSMISADWYDNDNTGLSGSNSTERNIIPSQTYGEYWIFDLIAVQVT
jgi:PKD repeat protein